MTESIEDRNVEVTFPHGCIQSSVLNTENRSTTLTVDIVKFVEPILGDQHVEVFMKEPYIQDLLMKRFFTKETLERGLIALKEREDTEHGQE